MIAEDICRTTVQPETRAEKIAKEVMVAVREATRAMEAEVAAMLEVEKAYRKANDMAAELRDSIDDNRVAVLSVRNARDRAEQARNEVKKTTRAEARAVREEELKEERWKAEAAKAAAAEKKGKSINLTVRDKAKHEAEESARRAGIAHQNAENAKKELMLADVEVKLTETETRLASAHVSTARENDDTARKEVEKAENVVKRALKVAKTALEDEISTKKVMDSMIMKLKTLVDNEARDARMTKAPGVKSESQNHDENEVKVPDRDEMVGGKTSNIGSGSDIYKGKVKFLIASPADYTMVKKFQDRLMKVDSFHVQAVYGSDTEGTQITVLVEQPVPLVRWLNEIEFIERVSRISRKEVEVSLKPAC